MAREARAGTARRNINNARINRGMYVEGNTARRLAEVPERRPRPNVPQTQRTRTRSARPETVVRQNRQLSREAQRNREKATGMSLGFVVFLAVISVAVLFCSVNFLRYRSDLTRRMRQSASLETELAQLREDNDAYYSQVTSNVDLSQIKQIAIGRLGMKYPSEEQTVTYMTEGSSYVRQYQDIPDLK